MNAFMAWLVFFCIGLMVMLIIYAVQYGLYRWVGTPTMRFDHFLISVIPVLATACTYLIVRYHLFGQAAPSTRDVSIGLFLGLLVSRVVFHKPWSNQLLRLGIPYYIQSFILIFVTALGYLAVRAHYSARSFSLGIAALDLILLFALSSACIVVVRIGKKYIFNNH